MFFFQKLFDQTVFASRRAFAAYRLQFALVVGAGVLLAIVVAYYAASMEALKVARSEALGLSSLGLQAPGAATVSASNRGELKTFRSSQLLAILEQGASTANIKLDEISFAIDESPGQPYVRYRGSFQVLSRYPTVHKLISEILAGSEGVVLDTVACRREDVTAADVRCDISAYIAYQENARG